MNLLLELLEEITVLSKAGGEIVLISMKPKELGHLIDRTDDRIIHGK